MTAWRLALLAAAAFGIHEAKAMRLDPEGGGQALIFPYYTVRSYGTDAFNTYISIVNTDNDGKALRVRFREGKAGLETLAFNLFLSPNDTWTGALIPSSDGGTQLITADKSCTSPMPAESGGIRSQSFQATQFATDGLGRTREGYIEVLEMATLRGTTLQAIQQDATNGIPRNCGAVQGDIASSDLYQPLGGLQGTATWINVASGMDFNLDAEAIADLTTAPYYRPATDPTPDFTLAQINPVSEIENGTHRYYLTWSSNADAVSSLFMRTTVRNEFVLDLATKSSTDWVLTFPTKRMYAFPTSATSPFHKPAGNQYPGCEPFAALPYSRDAQSQQPFSCDGLCPPLPPAAAACNAATVLTWSRADDTPVPVFGSANPAGYVAPWVGAATSSTRVAQGMQNGWVFLAFTGSGAPTGITSAPSKRMDLRTGAIESGTYRVQGVPVLGFMARTFLNGTLSCGGGKCQGNYGSAFALHGSRGIGPAP